MKTIILLLFVLACSSTVFGQEHIDPPKLPRNFNDTNFYNRTFNHFLIGWNNGGAGVKMDNALNINTNQYDFNLHWVNHDSTDSNYTSSTNYPMNIQWIQALKDADGRNAFDDGGGGRSICYEPTLEVDSSVFFTPRPYDQDGSVFGFKYKSPKGIILDSSQHTSTDYGCYFLNKDSVSSPTVVLDSVWRDEVLTFNGADTSTSILADTNNGKSWHLTINLKQKDTITFALLTDTILTLTMPYTWVHKDSISHFYTNTIQFDSVPGTTSSDIVGSLGDYRGKTKVYIQKTPQTRSFVITGAMLKHPSNKIDSSLTLSAHFYCNDKMDSTLFRYNPPLRDDRGDQSADHITNLGVQVKYHGKVSVAIEWIRIENPLAQRTFRGNRDRHLLLVIDSLTAVMQRGGNTAHARIHRFYNHDEPRIQSWGIMRYFNMLVDTLAVCEMGIANDNPLSEFLYATGHKAAWSGSSVQFDGWNGIAFIRQSYFNFTTGGISPGSFCFRNGYAGMNDPVWPPATGRIDSLQSAYETFLSGHDVVIPTPGPDTLYNDYFYPDSRTNYRYCIQYAIEEKLYKAHFLHPSLLYGKTPWWANQWINSERWIFYAPMSSFRLQAPGSATYRKPLTGEEVRVISGTSLILGAKGLLYWYKNTHHPEGWLGLEPNGDVHKTGPLVGKSFLRSDSLGGNYIKPGHDVNSNLFNTFSPTHYDFGIMGIDSTQIYIGLKSIRMEIAKTNAWITQNEDELMRLRLQAWYGKGFVKLYSQHPDYSSSEDILKKYVNYDSVKVRKLFLLDSGSVTANDTIYEHTDSTFYDITLLKDINRSMDSIIYIALDNRRTDPLIYFHDTSAAAWYMKFYPTDELDSLVTSADSAQFQQLWWRRLGCRKITLPFDYKDADKHYALLKIKELGAHDSVLAALAPYRNSQYLYKTVDTVIGQDRGLDITLLPGEFKILKVEILRSNDVAGELAHSNQTKLTAHALMRRYKGTGQWVESDTIVHYMTYHKQIPGRATGWTGVYFRKSKPASKYMNTVAIQWDTTEYLVSDTVYHNDTTLSWCDTCAYPSIVTRFDSTSLEYRSYIVYGCVTDTLALQNNNLQYIVESVVRVGHDTAVMGNIRGKSMATVGNRTMSEWGTPMVNASDTANFYCWADPDDGIYAGWKRPDSVPVPLVNNPIEIHFPAGWVGIYNAQHPSMNAYSRYMRDEHENDCALVWQQDYEYGYIPRVFYTRLRIVNGHIVNGLSPFTGDSNVIFNTDTTILCVSCAEDFLINGWFDEHRFPVVYRDLYLADTTEGVCDVERGTPYKRASYKLDRVYWQFQNPWGYDTPSPLNSKIKHRFIGSVDTLDNGGFKPNYLAVGSIDGIWKSQMYLDQPVVSAGDALYLRTTGFWAFLYNCFNWSERAMNLNFRSRPITIDSSIGYDFTVHDTLAQINHFPQYIFLELADQSVSTVDIGKLSQAHLAERGSVYSNDLQRNHRIYNKRTNQEPIPLPVPTIRTSGQYFFKTSGGQPIARRIQGFGDDSLSFGISTVMVNNHEYPLLLKQIESIMDALKTPDTISTDWFGVDNFEELRLITSGKTPNKLTALLERRRDGLVWEIQCEAGEQMKLSDELIDLLNGDDEEYRVRICSNHGAPYHPETAITTEEEAASYKRGGVANKSINLGDATNENVLTVFPNPAREHVTIQLQKSSSRSVVVRVVSALGNEIAKTIITNGTAWSIPTNSLPAGIYSVVAQTEETGILLGATKFVIVR